MCDQLGVFKNKVMSGKIISTARDPLAIIIIMIIIIIIIIIITINNRTVYLCVLWIPTIKKFVCI